MSESTLARLLEQRAIFAALSLIALTALVGYGKIDGGVFATCFVALCGGFLAASVMAERKGA